MADGKPSHPRGRLSASNLTDMRFCIAVLALASLAVAQSSTTPAPSATPGNAAPANSAAAVPTDQANAQKAKAILDQAIKALGGQAYLTWKTQNSEGRAYSFHHGEANSLGVLFWRFRQYPDKERVELTKKRDWYQIFDGNKGYEVTYRGVRNLEPKEELDPYLRRHHYALDIVLREWLNQPGVALFYEGQTVAAQKETDQVSIMNAKNEGVTLNLDINTHLPVKKSFTWRDPADQQRNTEDEIYDNYRMIQGIMTPYDVTRMFNGEMSGQSFLNAASYNQDYPADFFDPQVVSKRHH